MSGHAAMLSGGGGMWSSPRWKESTMLRAPLTSESPSNTEGTTSRTSINRVTSTAAVMRTATERSPKPLISVKDSGRDNGTPDDGYEEWPRDYETPQDKGGDHSYPDRGFDSALHEGTIGRGRLRRCHFGFR